MSEITTIREKVRKTVSSAYGEVGGVHDTSGFNVVFALIDDSLKKRPVESEKGIVRRVSVTSDYMRGTRIGEDQEKNLRGLYDRLRIEVMPKVNLDKGKVTFLNTIGHIQYVIKESGPSTIEPVWIEHADEGDLFYKDKDILHLAYNDPMGSLGFVNLGESERGRNHFKYPEFNGYSAPTLEFRIFDAPMPHLTEGPAIKYHFDILNKTYDRFQNLKQD